MSSRRQLLVGVALLAMLVVFAVASAGSSVETPYDLDAATPQGLRGLRLWLQEMGYVVKRTGTSHFAISRDTDLIFVYPNHRPYSGAEATRLGDWVLDGGALILIGPHPRDEALIDRFQIEPAVRSVPAEQVRQVQPLLPDSPAQWIQFGAGTGLELADAPQAVPILAAGEHVLLAVRNYGQGVIWYVSPLFDFTNSALRNKEQAILLPVLLRTVPAGATVLFDTYHLHSVDTEATQIASLQDWFYRTRPGQSLLMALAFLLVYLVLQGQRLGPPLAERHIGRPRSAVEFVEAMAGLQRRAHLRSAVADHHRRRLIMTVGQNLDVPPDLTEDDFVHSAQKASTGLTPQEATKLRRLLAGFNREPDETSLVRLVAETDEFLAGFGAGRFARRQTPRR